MFKMTGKKSGADEADESCAGDGAGRVLTGADPKQLIRARPRFLI